MSVHAGHTAPAAPEHAVTHAKEDLQNLLAETSAMLDKLQLMGSAPSKHVDSDAAMCGSAHGGTAASDSELEIESPIGSRVASDSSDLEEEVIWRPRARAPSSHVALAPSETAATAAAAGVKTAAAAETAVRRRAQGCCLDASTAACTLAERTPAPAASAASVSDPKLTAIFQGARGGGARTGSPRGVPAGPTHATAAAGGAETCGPRDETCEPQDGVPYGEGSGDDTELAGVWEVVEVKNHSPFDVVTRKGVAGGLKGRGARWVVSDSGPRRRVPIQYVAQLQIQMLAAGLTSALFVSRSSTLGTNVFRMWRDDEFCRLMVRCLVSL